MAVWSSQEPTNETAKSALIDSCELPDVPFSDIKYYTQKSIPSPACKSGLSEEKVMIYVPGSLHMFEGVPDQVTLSKAGKNYLLEHGIPEEHIYSDETNVKYKGEAGVYNSTDECYVACRVFEENSFGKLHCVCSSTQMMRKVLSYIRFGYVPYMHTVSCDRMFHSYIDEIFRNIPILLKDEDGLQGSFEEADCLREIRKPKA